MRGNPSIVLVVLVGCGGGGDGPDARPMIDAHVPGVDSATLTARIIVTQESNDPAPGSPIEGAHVLVVGGEIVDTDASGRADIIVDNDGVEVWVVRRPSGPISVGQIYYLTEVLPDAQIQLGAPLPAPAGVRGTLSIDFTPLAGATRYEPDPSLGGCAELDIGQPLPPGQIQYITGGCEVPARDLLITARNALDIPIGWLRVPGVAPAPGAIDATAIAWDTAGTTYTAEHAGHPSDIRSTSTYWYSAFSWRAPLTSGLVTLGEGSYAVTDGPLALPATPVTFLEHETASPQYIVQPMTTLPGYLFVDGTAVLPYVTDQSFDPTTRTISWRIATPGTVAPHLVAAQFGYSDPIDATDFRWTIYAPGDVTSLVIPPVPTAISSHELRPGDVVAPQVLLITDEGSSYPLLLNNIDLYQPHAAYTVPSTGRVLVSGLP